MRIDWNAVRRGALKYVILVAFITAWATLSEALLALLFPGVRKGGASEWLIFTHGYLDVLATLGMAYGIINLHRVLQKRIK